MVRSFMVGVGWWGTEDWWGIKFWMGVGAEWAGVKFLQLWLSLLVRNCVHLLINGRTCTSYYLRLT